MDELRNKAKELIESGTVKVLIGYEEGTGNKTRALFAENPDDTSKLVFDSRCVQNLAVYITKHEVKAKGKMGITATLPVMRSIIQLASEHQVNDTNLKVIGITPESKIVDFKDLAEVETFVHQFTLEIDEKNREMLNRLEKMTSEERWKFWMDELEPCFKCYACRAACPMCYCHRCTVEYNQPQWIPVPAHLSGNLEWHIMRANHLIGRCIDCDACANACPLAIPFNLLNKRMLEDAKKNFGGYQPSLKGDHLMSSFKPEDKENFIK
jgi:ferredoxin